MPLTNGSKSGSRRPKTYGSDGSGSGFGSVSATLVVTLRCLKKLLLDAGIRKYAFTQHAETVIRIKSKYPLTADPINFIGLIDANKRFKKD